MRLDDTSQNRSSRAVGCLSALGLRTPISSFGIAGLVFMSVVYFVGWRIETQKQEEADRNSILAANVAALSQDILEAGEVARAFLQARTEAAVANFDAIIARARHRVAAVDALAGLLDPMDPLKRAAGFGATIDMYEARFRTAVAAQRNLGLDESKGLQGDLRDAAEARDLDAIYRNLRPNLAAVDDIARKRYDEAQLSAAWLRQYAMYGISLITMLVGLLALYFGRRAERALAQSEERYRLLEGAVEDGLWDRNLLTDAEYFSPRWWIILGYSDGERPHSWPSFLDHVHPDDRASVIEAIQAHLERNEPYGLDYRMRCKDGGFRWVHSRGKALRDRAGRPVRMLGAITDISDRKRAEGLIEESRNNLARAERMARLGHIKFLLETGEYAWSEGVHRILGKSPDTFTPTFASAPDVIHPDDRPALEQYRRDVLAGLAPPRITLRAVKDNGEVVLIEFWLEPLRAGDGTVTGMFGTVQDVTERKQAEAALARTNAFFQTVIDNMPIMLTVKSASDLSYVLVNPTAERTLFKMPATAMIGKRSHDLVAPDQAVLFDTRDHEVLDRGRLVTFEHTVGDAESGIRHVIATKVPVLGADGVPQYLMTLAEDVTERKHAQTALARANQELIEKQYAIDQAVIVAITDLKGTITHVNENLCRISGYGREELLGRKLRMLRSGAHPPSFFEDMYRQVASGQVWRNEICNKAKDGSLYWVDTTVVPQLGPEGTPVAHLSICVDITGHKQAEAKISYMASHDALTGLGNRAILQERLRDALTRSRQRQKTFAVLLLDLDGFKQVNDTLGHAAGDELLKELARRLSSSLRETDVLTRLGGDEFAIVQGSEADQREAAIALALRVLDVVAVPFSLDGHDVTVGTSIGIAVAPKDGTTPGELLQSADLALYRVKADGRHNFRFFDEEMGKGSIARLRLLHDLRAAIARDELELHYQPIFDARTRRPCGVEALIRWHHPVEGPVPPDRFIPLAEESGLIGPLGEWILQKACADAARWPADIKVAVNLSAVQFRTGRLFDVILCVLVDSGLPPERLELEITESVLMQSTESNSAVLQQLKNIGVSIVLDDFGTGYSSLSYLTTFPFDKIKIDRSFTQGLLERADCAAIVASVLTLARGLDIAVTAEGVETKQQFDLLRAAGVHQVQGYLLGRPQSATELNFAALERTGQDVEAA